MSGSRSKNGCYTCRIRKKKCDEQKPFCQVCCSRGIHCYGYDVKPQWMQGLSSWKEVMESEEAKRISQSAEAKHKLRRRNKSIKRQDDHNLISEESDEGQQVDSVEPVHNTTTESTKIVESNNVSSSVVPRKQSYLSRSTVPTSMEHIYWDSGLPSTHLTSRSDKRLLITFLDVIFPLQYGFYGLSGNKDRSWLLHILGNTEPFCQASLSVTASFESRMRNSTQTDQTGTSNLDLDIRRLQIGALRGLQQRIDELSMEAFHGKDLLQRGMQALAIMTQLLSLEVFNFIEGQWEIHLQASRTILGMFQHKWTPELFTEKGTGFGASSTGDSIISQCSADDLKALEFFITSFVWVDIIANATHGPPPFSPRHFDYLPLLRNGYLKPQDLMGCQSCILSSIAEITAIEIWKNAQSRRGCLSVVQLGTRAAAMDDRLNIGIQRLESRLPINSTTSLQTDSDTVNLIFAYGALVYLHTIISGDSPHIPEIEHNVTQCLERFEVLPTHLLVRSCWPFTIAGCMATEGQYERFRNVITRTLAAKHVLGTAWKGLKVMEECWRLRKLEGGHWSWRSVMEKMNMRILLI